MSTYLWWAVCLLRAVRFFLVYPVFLFLFFFLYTVSFLFMFYFHFILLICWTFLFHLSCLAIPSSFSFSFVFHHLSLFWPLLWRKIMNKNRGIIFTEPGGLVVLFWRMRDEVFKIWRKERLKSDSHPHKKVKRKLIITIIKT